MPDILEVKNLRKIYQTKEGEVSAVDGVSFSVKKGEFVSIVGPSGCGKSTVLSLIAGLEKKDGGEVYINAKQVDGVSDNIGYMLQNHNLLEWRNIWKNALLGLEIRGAVSEESKEYVRELLKKYELDSFVRMHPSSLSGGMCQRAALIRTLAVKPEILLLDEAFSALDYQSRIEICDYVYKRIREQNISTLMVTHDIPESISMSDRVIVLTKSPAKIKKEISIRFDMEDDSPLKRREHEDFNKYFNLIYRELGVDE